LGSLDYRTRNWSFLSTQRSWLIPEEDQKLIEEINLLADSPDLQTHDEPWIEVGEQ
jgi:hypothetical protein